MYQLLVLRQNLWDIFFVKNEKDVYLHFRKHRHFQFKIETQMKFIRFFVYL